MKKDVLVSISGLQYEVDRDEPIEVISVGQYYNKNGKHYICYDEILEGIEGVTSCTVKVAPDQIDIIKRGSNNVHMIFEKGKKNTTFYSTPYGDLQIGIHTAKIQLGEAEDKLSIQINYGLDINYAFIADCQIQMKITSKKMADEY